jgi:WD40 repeat protein
MSNEPYPGLNPYFVKDAKRFFGRETQIENIIDRLTASRLTILYGESGVGKTSVVRAGVAAQLRQQAQENLINYEVPVHAVVVFPPFDLSWKDEPLPQLKRQIEQDIRELVPNIQPPEPELPFIKTLQAWTELLGGEEGDGELFIILDQFEEYFLYHHSSEPEEGTFAFEFPRAVIRSRLRVNFLISMREDSRAKLDYFKGRLLNLLSNTFELGHLDWNSAREAIKQPIYKYYNKEVSPEDPFDIEEQLIEQVLKEVSQKNNHNGRIEAPYLQLVMERLWQEEIKKRSHCLRLQTLTELGRAAGIAERHLNEKMELLSENERDIDIAANVFHYLVTPSGGKQAYRAFDLAELANREQRKGDRTEPIAEDELDLWLDKLTQKEFRLLRPVGKRPNLSYEIFHDMLAKPILAWLAGYVKKKEEEKAEQDAKHIRQKAKKIAKKEIQKAQKIANQKIRDAKQEAELKVEIAKQKAKWWLLRGIAVAVILGIVGIILGIVGIKNTEVLSEIGDLRARYSERSKNLSVESQDLTNLNRQYLPMLVQAGKKLQRQKLFLQMFVSSAYSIQKSGLLRLIGSVLFLLEENPETIINQGDGKSAWAFSPDGKKLAAGSEDGSIRLWDLQTQKSSVRVISPGDGSSVLSMSFSPDGKQLAAGSKDGSIRLWDLQTQKSSVRVISPGDGSSVLSMSFSPDGKQLAAGSKDGSIRLWDLQTQPPRETVLSPGDSSSSPVLSMSFSSNKQLATGSANGKISLWDLQTQKPSEAVISPGDRFSYPVWSMNFSQNGKQLATGSADGVVRLWDLQSQPKEQKPLRPSNIPLISREDCLLTISFNDDGRQLAVVSGKPKETASQQKKDLECTQEKISLFDQQGEQRIYDYSIEKDSSPITGITFSPDGKQLATVSRDGFVKIWPIYTFDELLKMGQTWVCTHSQDPEVIKDISCPNKTNSS